MENNNKRLVITTKLQALYGEYASHFKLITECFSDCGLNGPLLINPPESFVDDIKSIKILAINTTLNGWGETGEDISAGMLRYLSFRKEKNPQNSSFWEIFTALEKCFQKENNICFTALRKFTVEKGSPNEQLANYIKSFDVLLINEIIRLKPNVVLFFTAMENDIRLMQIFDGMRMHPQDNCNFDEIARIKHVFLPKATFRICTPKHIFEKGIQDKVLNTIKEEILKSNVSR